MQEGRSDPWAAPSRLDHSRSPLGSFVTSLLSSILQRSGHLTVSREGELTDVVSSNAEIMQGRETRRKATWTTDELAGGLLTRAST